jgi:hypothetical protein
MNRFRAQRQLMTLKIDFSHPWQSIFISAFFSLSHYNSLAFSSFHRFAKLRRHSPLSMSRTLAFFRVSVALVEAFFSCILRSWNGEINAFLINSLVTMATTTHRFGMANE